MLSLMLGLVGAAALSARADIQRVKVDKNYFYPLRGEFVQILNLEPIYEKTTIRIFSQNGYQIKTLLDDALPPSLTLTWDGKNAAGEVVAAGVYIIVTTGSKLHKRFRVLVLT
jgi:hypothetical protein